MTSGIQSSAFRSEGLKSQSHGVNEAHHRSDEKSRARQMGRMTVVTSGELAWARPDLPGCWRGGFATPVHTGLAKSSLCVLETASALTCISLSRTCTDLL